MSVQKILLATATMALVTLAGAASAASAHTVVTRTMTSHPVTTRTAVTIQAPAPRITTRHDLMARHPIVSDRIVLANLRAHRLVAIGRPHMVRGHLIVQARTRMGRIILVEVHPLSGRLIGVIRI